MYALLLVLGAAITVAGVVLLGAGMPVGERLYDPTVIMPGAVAVIGGLLLLGLGFAVRLLGRIERALAARPSAHSAHADDAAAPAVAAEPESVAPMVVPPPLPTDPPAIEPEIHSADAAAAPAVPAEEAAEQQQSVQDKFPALVRLDNAVALEEAEVALPKTQTRVEALGGFTAMLAPRGPVPPPRAVPRRDPPIRTAARPERRSLDSVWPKRSTPMRSSVPAQAASAEQLVMPEPVPLPEPVALPEPLPLPEPVELAMPAEPAPPPPAQLREPAAKPYTNGAGADAPVAVSILKSGIVDGMAYTLYSDGSIEAQLRNGTLRFNSITELRNHVEQNS